MAAPRTDSKVLAKPYNKKALITRVKDILKKKLKRELADNYTFLGLCCKGL
jgi:hypothetical protein